MKTEEKGVKTSLLFRSIFIFGQKRDWIWKSETGSGYVGIRKRTNTNGIQLKQAGQKMGPFSFQPYLGLHAYILYPHPLQITSSNKLILVVS